jgi:hypothetical protein
MIFLMNKWSFLACAVLLAGSAIAAEKAVQKEAPAHLSITDPKVYIPLREGMTALEMRFVDLQIMAVEDKVDYKAVKKALEDMEASTRKVRRVNPSQALNEPLEKLAGQIDGLQRDARRKDLAALKGNLDLLFQTCFKCHQAHAPLRE